MSERPDSEPQWQTSVREVLADYALVPHRMARVPQGLVNHTFDVQVEGGERLIVQRLHPVFHASVNHNIAAVTEHLAARGQPTPRLLRSTAGACFVERDGQVWRVLSFVEGVAYDRLEDAGQAREAGRLLARFHAAMADFDGELVSQRPPVHDLARHLAHLEAALAGATGHRLHREVCAARDRVLALLAGAPAVPDAPSRVVHGDPKISNLLFDPGGRACCLIDLDTVTWMPLAVELGDAFRSWCNPRGEDAPDAVFDLELFAGALAGYAEGAPGLLSAPEREGIVPATLRIHAELAARFLADALEERYFSWDAARWPGHGEHNLARAHGQLAAAQSLRGALPRATELVGAVFAGA